MFHRKWRGTDYALACRRAAAAGAAAQGGRRRHARAAQAVGHHGRARAPPRAGARSAALGGPSHCGAR